jgi:hypothetical protein
LENWIKGTGPAHIFIYYQKPYKTNEQTGETTEIPGSTDQFFVTDGKF